MFGGFINHRVPVLYQINNLDEDGFFYFKLDSEEYTLFPQMQEVLLANNISFNIIEISE